MKSDYNDLRYWKDENNKINFVKNKAYKKVLELEKNKKPIFMNCYVSGSHGFIGKALVKRLENLGHEVYPLERGLSVKDLALKLSVKNPDLIFHLAAYGNHFDQHNISTMMEVNINGTSNLLRAAGMFGYRMFYNFSTSSVTLKHQTTYSRTKLCTELMAECYERTVNIRPYSVYGPGEASHRFIPTVIRCLNTGESMSLDCNATHDWIYIDSFLDAMFAGHTSIGTGIKTTNLEVVKMLEEISGKKLNFVEKQLRPYDNENWCAAVGVPDIGLFNGLKLIYNDSIK